MKRRPPVLWTILLFLLLGAILNVAVAWGCTFAAAFKTDDKQTLDHHAMPIRIRELHKSHLPSDIIDADPLCALYSHYGYRMYSIGSFVTEYDIKQDPPGMIFQRMDHFFTLTTESGWPFQSLWDYTVSESRRGTQNPTRISIKKEFGQYWVNLAPIGVNRHIRLPLYVRWWATAGNTLFYATILWLLYQGFFILRRHRRIRRGRCGQCGYIVAPNIGVPGASPNCPECGTPIPPGTRNR